MCAGIISFNAVRNSGARLETVAVSRSAYKKNLAFKLGARTYIDAASPDVAKELLAFRGRSRYF
jgi:D-arabinose 1-dehydrogenase-like Zn-dependent alcohol dehydrogenase